MQADCPESVLKPARLGILNQRKPGCLAALYARKLLGRHGGAIYGPAEPADDDQDIAHNNLHGLRRRRSAATRSGSRLLAEGKRGQGVQMSLIGLVSDMAEQRGSLRLDAAPGDLYLGVRGALAASPRLGSSRRVSGDVITDESAGSATGRSTCLSGGRGYRNCEISIEELLRRTCDA